MKMLTEMKALVRQVTYPIVSIFFLLGLFYISTSLTLILLPAYFVLKPVNNALFIRMGNILLNNFLALVVHVIDLWCEVKLEIHGKLPSAEDGTSILIPNHLSHDWPIICALAYHRSSLGNLKIVLKDIAKYIPGYGWSIWLMSWPFVSRNWKKDEARLKAIFKAYALQTEKTILCIFCEGTRMTSKSLQLSQEFAASNPEYPTLEYCLVPRPRGFIAAVRAFSEVSSGCIPVYNITLIYDGFEVRNPSIASILFEYPRTKRSVKVLSSREEIRDATSLSDSDMKSWLFERFCEKDHVLRQHYTTKLFRQEKRHNISSPSLSVSTLMPHLLFCLIGSGIVTFGLSHVLSH